MHIKTFLINLLLGIISVVLTFANVVVFTWPFASADDNNWPTIVVDIVWVLGIIAYNAISIKRKGIKSKDILLNRLLPFMAPFAVALCVLLIYSVIDAVSTAQLPEAVPKLD